MRFYHGLQNIPRVSPELVEAFRELAAATVHEAQGKSGYISCRIHALSREMRLCGPAFTVDCPPGDNGTIHKALELARPGDILMVTTQGAEEYGYWGDMMTVSALSKGLGGLCLEGCVRDSTEIIASGFPVFATGCCIRGTLRGKAGLINYPLFFGGAQIHPGDLILGDADGLVVVPRENCPEVLEKARARVEAEKAKSAVLAAGTSSFAYNKLESLFAALGFRTEPLREEAEENKP